MDTEKSSYQVECTYDTQFDTSVVSPLPTLNVRVRQLSNKDEVKNIWTPFYVLGVFGCMYFLFHLYVSTAYHHAALDNGLHKLEEEMHAMIELQRASGNISATNTVGLPIVTPVRHAHHGYDRILHRILPHERKRNLGSNKWAKSRMVENQLVKRGGSVLTWFKPGEGACGGHSDSNEFIAAISYKIWDGGAHCGDKISISYRGKTATATVVDECMGCESGHIDLSPGLLHFLAGAGTDMVTDANWVFGDFDTPKPTPKPTPSTTYHSTTIDKPTTATKSSSTSTTSTTKASSSSSSSSSSSTLSTAISSSASAYVTPAAYDDSQVHNIEDVEVLLVGLGQLVTLGAFGKE